MRLDHMTWREVEAYLADHDGILIPVGSTEQHGPMGLIGTDALCAEAVADGVAARIGAISAPCLAYTPAPFNLAFPGSVSISPGVLVAMVDEIVAGLASQGFRHFYFVNAHGANLAPLAEVTLPAKTAVRVRSWWDFEAVNALRRAHFGDWEGMHATPSEISITQALHRIVAIPEEAADPPEKLSPDFIREHAGDKHGPPEEHRAAFPDGRVGSHSALAEPELGRALLEAVITSAAGDYEEFVSG